jgi:hypothetical protein
MSILCILYFYALYLLLGKKNDIDLAAIGPCQTGRQVLRLVVTITFLEKLKFFQNYHFFKILVKNISLLILKNIFQNGKGASVECPVEKTFQWKSWNVEWD